MTKLSAYNSYDSLCVLHSYKIVKGATATLFLMYIFVESIAEYILEECGMAFYGVDSLKIFAFYTTQ